METDTYSNPQVIEFSNKNFLNVVINFREGDPVGRQFDVAGIPVTFL